MIFCFENKHNLLKARRIAITKHFEFLKNSQLFDGFLHGLSTALRDVKTNFEVVISFLMKSCFESKQRAMKALCIAIVKHLGIFQNDNTFVGFQHFFYKTHIEAKINFVLEKPGFDEILF